jgi:DNA-directed RNA polymerase subunit E'/Rpb7
MFFLTSLTKELSISPSDLVYDSTGDLKIEKVISSKINDLEGKIIGENGYIINIVEFTPKSEGIIDNETGKVNYKIDYKAITFKLLESETVQVLIENINEHGLFCRLGPIQIFVSKYILESYVYNSIDNTWSRVQTDDPKSVSVDHKSVFVDHKSMKIGDIIFVEIIAYKVNTNEMTALAKIKN